jgi:hypothetical protein
MNDLTIFLNNLKNSLQIIINDIDKFIKDDFMINNSVIVPPPVITPPIEQPTKKNNSIFCNPDVITKYSTETIPVTNNTPIPNSKNASVQDILNKVIGTLQESLSTKPAPPEPTPVSDVKQDRKNIKIESPEEVVKMVKKMRESSKKLDEASIMALPDDDMRKLKLIQDKITKGV